MSETKRDASGGGRVRDTLPIVLLKKFTAGLDGISFWAIAVTMAGMAVIVVAQVVARYAFASSIDAADELSRLLFVWVTFLAIPHGIKIGIHVGIDVVMRLTPDGVRGVAFRAVNLVCALFMAVLAHLSFGAIADKWQDLMPTLDVTGAVFYVPILICAVHGFFHFIVLAVGGEHAWSEVELAADNPGGERA